MEDRGDLIVEVKHGDSDSSYIAYQCGFCSKILKTQEILNRHHSLAHRSDTEESYNCRFCGKKFGLVSHLKIHVSQVHSVNPAEVMVIETKQESTVQIDNITNDVHQEYSCRYCKKTFTSAVVCRNHELIHDYTKVCPYCPRKFFQDSHLRFHLRTHGINDITDNVKVETEEIPVDVMSKLKKVEKIEDLLAIPKKQKNRSDTLERGEIKQIKIKDNQNQVVQVSSIRDYRKSFKRKIQNVEEEETPIDLLVEEEPILESSNEYEEYKPKLKSFSSCCCKIKFFELSELLCHIQEIHNDVFRSTMSGFVESITYQIDNNVSQKVKNLSTY